MNTPTPLKVTSKYLSPCRTFGLKRKSTSKTPIGLKLLHKNDNVCFSTTLKCNNENNEPETHSHKLTKIIKHQPRSTVFNETSKHQKKLDSSSYDVHERGNPLENIENIVVNENPTKENTTQKVIGADDAPFRGFASKEDVVDLIKIVNFKIAEVNKLKRTQIYSKKHNLHELRQSTKIWKQGCQEIIWALHKELQMKGKEVPLDVILREHSIPFDVIGFNEDIMDFDS